MTDRELDDLKPAPYNPRKISEAQLASFHVAKHKCLAASLGIALPCTLS